MRDERKIKSLKLIGEFLLLVFVALVAFSIGTAQHPAQKAVPVKTKVAAQKAQNSLTQARIKDYLKAYYTRKDLGTNRKAYKPYMTTNWYELTVNSEDSNQSQAVKGLIIDQKLMSEKSYIDAKNATAICEIAYSNVNLKNKPTQQNPHPPRAEMTSRATLLLHYKKVKGAWLVNKVESYSPVSPQSGGQNGK